MPLTLASNVITFPDQSIVSSATIKWTNISLPTNLSVYNKYLTNTSVAGFTVTLPSAPSDGNYIVIADGNGTWSTNILTVNRNGKLIDGLAENLICDVSYGKVELVYVNSANSWRTTIF